METNLDVILYMAVICGFIKAFFSVTTARSTSGGYRGSDNLFNYLFKDNR